MGMFDSLYDGPPHSFARSWQTKAYECNLENYDIGDVMPPIDGVPDTYQVEVFGGDYEMRDSLATVVKGILVSVDNERAHSLPLVNYSGAVVA